MRFLNRTKMIGKEKAKRVPYPWILMSNHVSLLDDLFLGPIIFFPRALGGYKAIPYHAPEERNFYKKPIVSWFMKQTKSIPLVRGKGIHQEGMNRLISAVRNGGTLHIYPEGTRTRSGDIGAAKAGIGRLIYESGAPVVPMYHRGLDQVLPIGAGAPRIGKRIYVSIGDPIYFDEELKLPNTPETWRKMAGRVMDGIRAEKLRLESRFGSELPAPVVFAEAKAPKAASGDGEA